MESRRIPYLDIIGESFVLLYVVIICIVFLYINNTTNSFTRSPIYGHLGYSQFGAIMNEPAMNILAYYFGEHKHLFLLGKYPGVKLSGDGAYGC